MIREIDLKVNNLVKYRIFNIIHVVKNAKKENN
jgi:hypothetical protein